MQTASTSNNPGERVEFSQELLTLVIAAAQASPTADNTQPFSYEWQNHSLLVSYDTERVGHRTFAAESPATALALGCVLENLTQLAALCHLRLERSFPTTSPLPLSLTLTPTLPLSAQELNQAGNAPLFKRHTNRFKYLNTKLDTDTLDAALGLQAGAARIIRIDDKAQRDQLAEVTGLASQIRFQTRAVHEWLGDCLRFTRDQVSQGDGLDVRTLGLPPGGGLVMKLTQSWSRMKWLNKFGAYKFMASVDAGSIAAAPALFAVVAENSALSALDAGVTLERLWIYLNAQGIAVQPYYVIADQLNRHQEGSVPENLVPLAAEIGRRTHSTLALKPGETLHMLLRAGLPKQPHPPRSARLPRDMVFTNLDLNKNQ